MEPPNAWPFAQRLSLQRPPSARDHRRQRFVPLGLQGRVETAKDGAPVGVGYQPRCLVCISTPIHMYVY